MLFSLTSRKIPEFILLFLFAILFVHCKKDRVSDDTYFNSKTMILGHRGMGVLYNKPANTFESVSPVIGIGADGAELDIQMTKDSVLVLFHDQMLNQLTTCTGRINEYTWEEIRQCKYYSVKNMVFVNSADELFTKLSDLSKLYFSFDCKMDTLVPDFDLYQQQYLRAIKQLCEKHNMSNNVFIEGGESFLILARTLGLSNKLFLVEDLNEGSIEIAALNTFWGISASTGGLNADVEKAHRKGLYLMLYSPNNYQQNKEALEKNPDIIQTDDPISLLKLLNRYNYEYIIP